MKTQIYKNEKQIKMLKNSNSIREIHLSLTKDFGGNPVVC